MTRACGIGEWAFHFLAPRGRHKTVAVLQAIEFYGDDSADSKAERLCVVNGLVGSSKEWRRLEVRWAKITKGVPFHSVRFFGRGEKGQRLDHYSSWSTDRAVDFITQLCRAIADCNLSVIGAHVDVRAFKALSIGARRYLTQATFHDGYDVWRNTGAPNKPYFVAFGDCIAKAVHHKTRPDWKVNFWFDRQGKDESLAYQLFKDATGPGTAQKVRDSLGALVFGSKDDYLGLQAADLVAYVGCAGELGTSDEGTGRRKFWTPKNVELEIAAEILMGLPRKRNNVSHLDAARLEKRLSVVPQHIRDKWDTAKLKGRKTGKRAWPKG